MLSSLGYKNIPSGKIKIGFWNTGSSKWYIYIKLYPTSHQTHYVNDKNKPGNTVYRNNQLILTNLINP
jgi:hypothetical protein